MKLDIVIELSAPTSSAGLSEIIPRVPCLETLLARGDSFTPSSATLDKLLLASFGFQGAAIVPSAALCALGDGVDPNQDYWLRADPVCLAPTRTHLTLVELPEDDLTPTEAQLLSAAVSAHLSACTCRLVTPHPQRWYLRLPDALAMRTLPPSLCSGNLQESHLPSGPDSAAWKRLITEVQMILHAHPVNVARENAGKLPANAIWPWGGGRLSGGAAQSSYRHVWSNDPLTRGLARAAGTTAHGLPPHAKHLFASDCVSGLVVLNVPRDLDTFETLERVWFQEMLAALGDGRLTELLLTVLFPKGTIARRTTSANLRRWWRRARPLPVYA
jgi:hypothetical protein